MAISASIKKRAEEIKFKQQKIKLVGYNKRGSNIQATVASLRSKSNTMENYAWIISGEDLVFLQETMFDNVYEPCIKVPLAVWLAFKMNYKNKLDDVHEKYMNHLVGVKINKLRSTYTYNPFLDPNDKPWWNKYKIIHEKINDKLKDNFLTPKEIEKDPRAFDNMTALGKTPYQRRRRIRSAIKKRKKMSEIFLKRYTDPLLHLDYKAEGL